MLHCKNCKVNLPDDPLQCPLCQGDLSGTPREEGNVFPVLSRHTIPSRSLLAKVTFCSVAIAAVCLAINLSLPGGGWWFLFVVAGIASLWVDFALILKKRKNLHKNILWQVTAISLIAYVWDRFTGFHGWSLDYVLPILCTCAMIAMFVVAKARRLHIQEYILYLVMVCILGMLSFILIVGGAVRVAVPSAICFASSVLFLASLLFFEGKALHTEIQRRLHL